MKFSKIFGLASIGALVATAAFAANGSWSALYTDKANNTFIYGISTTTSLATPPLPLNFVGSRVAMSVVNVSGTAISSTIWGTIAGPVGTSATVTQNSATILPASNIPAGGSLTVVTTSNLYHDVGMTISNTTGQLINIRAIETRQ